LVQRASEVDMNFAGNKLKIMIMSAAHDGVTMAAVRWNLAWILKARQLLRMLDPKRSKRLQQ
jgi:hypothetical protein